MGSAVHVVDWTLSRCQIIVSFCNLMDPESCGTLFLLTIRLLWAALAALTGIEHETGIAPCLCPVLPDLSKYATHLPGSRPDQALCMSMSLLTLHPPAQQTNKHPASGSNPALQERLVCSLMRRRSGRIGDLADTLLTRKQHAFSFPLRNKVGRVEN